MCPSPTHMAAARRPEMRSILVLFCSLAISVALQPGTASAAPLRMRHLCSTHKCRTLAADAQVRVFQATAKHPGRENYASTFAQWLPTRRVTALGDSARFEAPTLQGSPALAGRFVSYGLQITAERSPGQGFEGAVARLNVQTGRRESFEANGAQGGGFGENSPGVIDVAVTPAGSTAWIIDGSYQDPAGPHLPGPASVLPLGSKTVYEVLAGSKAPVALATNPTIDPKSLAAIPGHLYWAEGGAARTALVQ
jgi:hypothetical protein